MTAPRPADFSSAATQLDRPTYENLRRALQLGRWPDGRRLDDRQRAICTEAVFTWERAHLPPEEHSGFVPRSTCGDEDVRPLRILGED